MHATASLGASCDWSMAFPPDGFGRQVVTRSHIDLHERATALFVGYVRDEYPVGTATYTFECTDALGASHVDSGSFQILPAESSSSPTVGQPNPTGAPTPGGDPSATAS